MATEQESTGGEAGNNKKKTGVAVVFGIIEIVSLVLWQTADNFSGASAYWIHWISECGFLAGAAYLAFESSKNALVRSLIYIAFIFLCIILWDTKGDKSNAALAVKTELKTPVISQSVVSTNAEQKKVEVLDEDNPATSISDYISGQTVIQFAEIYKSEPTELAFEASNQLAKHHPKCSVYLFEKAESYYEHDPSQSSSAWRQRRPDYACALFLSDRESEAVEQLHKLISDLKSAVTNPTSTLTTTAYVQRYVDKTLEAEMNALMTNCQSKPASAEYIGETWNEYNLLEYQIRVVCD